jgi:hypothetical protein
LHSAIVVAAQSWWQRQRLDRLGPGRRCRERHAGNEAGAGEQENTVRTSTSQGLAGSRVGMPATEAGPLLWQRTDTIGTELVVPAGETASNGTAVVSGSRPWATRWRAERDADWTVRELTVTCEGSGWRRELILSRDAHSAGDGHGWTCRTETVGDLDGPEPGFDGAAPDEMVVRLADSPVFLTWALRALRLRSAGEAVTATTARILTPSLAVVVGESRYQRIGDHRLRVSGGEPAASYDLDGSGVVTYQPGRLRIVR